MFTSQNYVGRENYATKNSSLDTYQEQLTKRVASISALSGLPTSIVWQRLFHLTECFYNIKIDELPKESGQESLLVVAERYDLLDKLFLVAQAEEINYLPF